MGIPRIEYRTRINNRNVKNNFSQKICFLKKNIYICTGFNFSFTMKSLMTQQPRHLQPQVEWGRYA